MATADTILAVDVHYADDGAAWAGAVRFAGWSAPTALARHALRTTVAAPYVPGAFFQRELPAILPLIRPLLSRRAVHTVVVDGHVDVGPDRPGLGRRLFEALGGAVRVVGVAKQPFEGAPALPVRRGGASQPLWVSATSAPEDAAAAIASMHGAHRLPTLLTLADHVARGHAPADPGADLLLLSWPHGRAAVAPLVDELPPTLRVTPSPGPPVEVTLPANGPGLTQAVAVRLSCQTASGGSYHAQLAGRFDPDERGTLTLRLRGDCQDHRVVADVVRGARSVEVRPSGVLDAALFVHPTDDRPWAWSRAAAAAVRLCVADTARLDEAALGALAQATAAWWAEPRHSGSQDG